MNTTETEITTQDIEILIEELKADLEANRRLDAEEYWLKEIYPQIQANAKRIRKKLRKELND